MASAVLRASGWNRRCSRCVQHRVTPRPHKHPATNHRSPPTPHQPRTTHVSGPSTSASRTRAAAPRIPSRTDSRPASGIAVDGHRPTVVLPTPISVSPTHCRCPPHHGSPGTPGPLGQCRLDGCSFWRSTQRSAFRLSLEIQPGPCCRPRQHGPPARRRGLPTPHPVHVRRPTGHTAARWLDPLARVSDFGQKRAIARLSAPPLPTRNQSELPPRNPPSTRRRRG